MKNFSIWAFIGILFSALYFGISKSDMSVLPLAQVSTMNITNFVLVDARTNEDISFIADGDYLILEYLPEELNIRIEANGSYESIKFGFNESSSYRVENQSPFSLGGDTDGDFNPFNLISGQYKITATPFAGVNASGNSGNEKTVSFTIVQNEKDAPFSNNDLSIAFLEIIDPNSDTPIRKILDNDVLNLAELGNEINIRAETKGANVKSVRFALDDNEYYRLENQAPFAIGGASPEGDFYSWQPSLGSHTLSVYAHSEINGNGIQSIPYSVTFLVSDGSLQSASENGANTIDFIVVNTLTQKDIMEIQDGDNISIVEYGKNLNIRAEGPFGTKSIQFGYNDIPVYSIENSEPFSFAGDSNGEYISWALGTGEHRLVARAFPDVTSQGSILAEREIVFSLQDGSSKNFENSGEGEKKNNIKNVEPVREIVFNEGEKVIVDVSTYLYVRSAPGSGNSIMGSEKNGAMGSIVEGPQTAGEYNWYNVRFESGINGWVPEDFLNIVIS